MGTLHLIEKTANSIKNDGIKGCAKKINRYVKKRAGTNKGRFSVYKDVLFVSGCNEDLPHPWRYRVKHQREQLEAFNISTDEIYFTDIQLEHLRFYRMFVFFRCPETDGIARFVKTAKKLNKTLIYDIDDLVIDTCYTDTIKYVAALSQKDKEAYDFNVLQMQSLLKKCDFAITTTGCLQEELKHYITKVYINRNVASEEMVQLSKAAVKKKVKEHEKVRIGYFSGSITHNADFDMIKNVIIRIMKKYSEVELDLAGELDLPDDLQCFSSRIRKIPFGDWKSLPDKIAATDINIAPLEDTIFNCAKSENKWTEAALVKVPTIASDVGAFHDCIENGITGILCRTEAEWEEALERLITDPEYRKRIGQAAYDHCIQYSTTLQTGCRLAQILQGECRDNIAFVLPGLAISGGIRVALKHASVLQKAGNQVSLLCLESDKKWYRFDDSQFPVLDLSRVDIQGKIGHMVATMWTTVSYVEACMYAEDKCYLVQNYETDFYAEGDPLRAEANRSYSPYSNVRFLTISKWCQQWLKEKYGQYAYYVPNGIDIESFPHHKRKMTGKIKILIEGDCAVDYKNVDEAFEVTNSLDPSRFEVWYMSYNAEPKKKYRVDRFCHKVPYEKVPEIYGECDILLKTSLLESFSYPPLEMMASGGFVIAVPNGGNAEYLEDGRNCLLYRSGQIEEARTQIYRLICDTVLQEQLYRNGLETAAGRNWKSLERKILNLYCENKNM